MDFLGNLSLKEALNYSLISTDNLTVSVYSVVLALAIIGITLLITGLVKRLFKRLIAKNRIDRGTGMSVFTLVKYFIWVIILVLILDTFGVKISILLASLAALLVGVGFGIQQVFSDVASGILILIEQNLKVSDVIQLDDGTVGRVTSIGLRTSKIETRDDIIMIVPNSRFVMDEIINWSHMETNTRFHVNVGVAYGSDVELVKKSLLECAEKHSDISHFPQPFVRFNDFGNSSLDFQLYFWVHKTFKVENIKSDLRFSIDKIFRENKIQIPFPQRDVHFKTPLSTSTPASGS